MERYVVKNLDRLRRVLENHRNPLLRELYASYIGSDVVSARVDMYEHPNGCEVVGKPGRWWVYVRVRSSRGAEYDITLWKLLRHREVYELLRDAVEEKCTVDEDRAMA